MQVVNCTTPSQYFHVLRRQMKRSYRAPLVIFTPKSLLRHPKAAAQIAEFASGGFQQVIDDPIASERPDDVRRVFACTGKVYYDLLAEREKRLGDRQHEIAILRVEQLYPWPERRLQEIFARYGGARGWTWVQEEPLNMGAWTFVRERLRIVLADKVPLEHAGRPESASPAAGSPRIHKAQLEQLLEDAFGDRDR